MTQTSVRAVTSGHPHFFGYYDKCPWSFDGRRMLACRAPFQDRPPTEQDPLILGVVDLDRREFEPFAETTAWCWQQGTMLQWLPDGSVIYNSRRDGRLVGVINNLATGRTRELPRPVYAVHPGGHEAISLDFHRLQTLRPGYGYPPGIELSPSNLAPDDIGLWRIDLEAAKAELILSIAQARAHQHDPRSDNVPNWFNHVTYNTDGSRFCFLHRFKCADGSIGPWVTRLFTLDSRGSELYLLNPYGKTSHFDWRDPKHLVAWCNQPRAGREGTVDAYYVLEDGTGRSEPLGEGTLTRDGHMTYSPDRRWLLTDEYPDKRDGCRPLLLYELATGRRIEVGRFFAPPQLHGELRCDLHPRWNRNGTQVCIDSAHEGVRQMYVVDVSSITRG
jgi:hypothetical protein